MTCGPGALRGFPGVTATTNSVTSRNLTHRVLRVCHSADLSTPLCGRRSCGLERGKLHRGARVLACPARPEARSQPSSAPLPFPAELAAAPRSPALSTRTDPEALPCAEEQPPAARTEPGSSFHLAFLCQVSKHGITRGPRHCVRSRRREACSFCLPQKALLERSTAVTHLRSRQQARSRQLGLTN